ncbi:cation diffusion facilitator family transporter [Paraburkholderia sp. HC6.4b]|uniref:CDF family Co(II)/Ni(II) efflux transporter DmeF n=1 Tax=unclassified Paraburkholderia TaxID=2615204 RepID=UPI00160B03BF|nr:MULTISPECIES: CDF family Co(II)/Ni(II) efflux transporter DmeF [unclassified Paraburkholderia]MBB5408808.1 cation diffusion facilitator family transporter [Paraburkholderia sp. HC6.4b]MBB5455433.1 cation diffusion facilitator family transporter [Paraburkholderia sp. Kb1A]
MTDQLIRKHEHSFLGSSHDDNARRTHFVVALTVVMMIGEIAAGYVTGSMALLADGFHMATHAGALGIAALAYAFARRNSANRAFSFGTGKVGELAGFASALILALVSLGIGIESAIRLVHPTGVAFGQAAVIAAIGLVVNIVSALLLSGGHAHHGHHDHHHHHDHAHGSDNNLRSAYVHVLADALTSVLAIVAMLAGRYLGWVWTDPLMGIVGSIVIARWAWTLMHDTAGVLLDRTDEHVAGEIREILDSHGDAEIADLHVWQIGPEARAAIVSVRTHGGVTAETIRARLAPVHEVMHLTVEAAS